MNGKKHGRNVYYLQLLQHLIKVISLITPDFKVYVLNNFQLTTISGNITYSISDHLIQFIILDDL